MSHLSQYPEPTLLTSFLPPLPRRHQSDGNEIAHTRLRASTRDLQASPKPTSKSTIEEDLKKLIDLESPTPESQKNFKVEGRLWGNGREKLGMMGCVGLRVLGDPSPSMLSALLCSHSSLVPC